VTTPEFSFRVEARARDSAARSGVFSTPHGDVPTPAFMPVGTRGTVKGVLPRDLAEAGATMILANALHLHQRPGEAVVEFLGGLHAFMGWPGPILTDSGGYQVFSMRDACDLDEQGATFRSSADGSRVRFTPERAMDVQRALGADVIMAFDHCPADPLEREAVRQATDRTHRWLDRSVRRWRENGGLAAGQALFGIVQGGAFEDLRRGSVESVAAHDLVGYAIGGTSLGEQREATFDAVAAAAPLLPDDRPRYLMGVGTPLDFLEAVERGVDLFDCVTPTRHARNDQAYTSRGRVNLRNRRWIDERSPLDPTCDCPACTGYPTGVLRHLAVTREMLAGVLLSLHNLRVFHRLLARIRAAVAEDRLAGLRQEIEAMQGRA